MPDGSGISTTPGRTTTARPRSETNLATGGRAAEIRQSGAPRRTRRSRSAVTDRDMLVTAATPGAARPIPGLPGLPGPLTDPRNMARIPGRITTPRIVAGVDDMLAQAKRGTLTASVPLGARDIGLVSIRPGTTAVAEFAIKDGKAQFDRTQIRFVDQNGRPTDLDGPLWWDAEKIYIDSDGKIRAEVPCFPDPNITKQILGPEHSRVPEDVGAFVRALAKQADVSHDIELHPGARIGSGKDANRPGSTSQSSPSSDAASGGNELEGVVDLPNLKIDADLEFTPGPMRFGDGTVMNLAPGSRARASGKLSDLTFDVQARLTDPRGLEMKADGTTLSTGGGEADVRVNLRDQGETSAVGVSIVNLDVSHLDVKTPGSTREHSLHVGQFALRGGEEPIVQYQSAANGGSSSVVINIEDVQFNDVSGTFEAEGTDGKPAVMTLGRRAEASEEPLNVRGSLQVDTRADTFRFESHSQNLEASIGRIALVDVPDFDMVLDESAVRGSGTFLFEKAGDSSRTRITADEGTQWQVQASLYDAHFGNDTVTFALNHQGIIFQGKPLPRFAGASIAVERTVYEGAGEEDEMAASIRIPLHPEAELPDSGPIPGVPGARVERAADGNRTLVLDAHLTKKGSIRTTPQAQFKELSRGSQINIEADLATDTAGTIHFRELDFRTDSPPVFSGGTREGEGPPAMQFTVKLDALRIPVGEGQIVEFKPRSDGRLRIPHLEWKEGAKSPSMRAELRISLGVNAGFRPEELPGLEGARVEVEVNANDPTKPPETVLVLDVNLTEDGLFAANADISLRGVELRTSLTRGKIDPVERATIPAQPLTPQEPANMRSLRRIERIEHEHQAPEAKPPKVTPIEIRPTEILKSVDGAALNIEVPVDAMTSLRVIDDRLAGVLDVTVDATRVEHAINLNLRTVGGAVIEDRSRLELHEPLNVRIHAAVAGIGWPNTTLQGQVRGLTIKKDPETGRGYFWPEMEFDGTIPDALEALSLDDNVKRAVGRTIANALFGTDGVPLDLDEMLPKLETRFPDLAEPIIIDPVIPPWIETQKAAQLRGQGFLEAAESSDKPSETGDNRDAWEIPPTGIPGVDALLKKLRVHETKFGIEEATFSSTRLDLGNGQHISFRPGTDLRVTGDLSDFTISGTAQLGTMKLGSEDLGASLKTGSAELKIRVQKTETGEPRVSLDIENLRATDLTARARSGGATVQILDADIPDTPETVTEGGTLHMSFGPQESNFSIVLPDVAAELVAGGSGSAGGTTAGADEVRARVDGKVSIINGVLEGDFDDVSVVAQGFNFANGDTVAHGNIHMRGPARIHTRDGNLHILPPEAGVDENGIPKKPASQLVVNTDIRFDDGSKFIVEQGSASHIGIGLSDEQFLDIRGLAAEHVDILTEVDIEDGVPPTLIDIQRGSVERVDDESGIRIDSDGFKTHGRLKMDNVLGSVANIPEFSTGEAGAQIRQVDFVGSGYLSIVPGDGFLIQGERRIEGNTVKSSLRARAVGEKLDFNVRSPEFNFHMQPGVFVEGDLNLIDVDIANDGVRMDFTEADFNGAIKEGWVTIANEGSAFEQLSLEPGTLVEGELKRFALVGGSFAENPEASALASVDGRLRVEGRIADRFTPDNAKVAVDDGKVQLDSVEIDGLLKLALNLRLHDRDFSASSHAKFDADATLRASGQMDVRETYERFRRRARENAQAHANP